MTDTTGYPYADCPPWLRITDYDIRRDEDIVKGTDKRIRASNLLFDIAGHEVFFLRIGDFVDTACPMLFDATKRKRLINRILCSIVRGQVVFFGAVLIKYDLYDPEEIDAMQLELI